MTRSSNRRLAAGALLATLAHLAVPTGEASAQSPDRAAMEARRYLSLARDFMNECDNAAWSLWFSNDYEKWRKSRRGMLSINYHSRAMEKTPSAPSSLDPALGKQIDEQIAKANDIVRGAQAKFGIMANYINAKDYEDDKFKKGDELNAQLVDAGKSCFAVSGTLAPLFAKAQEQRAGMPPMNPVREAIREDYDRARALEAALAKGAGNSDEIARAVAELSQAIEQRQTALASELADRSKPIAIFYRILNEDIAVPMRRLLRDREKSAKTWTEAFEDRPRALVARMRSTILRAISENYAEAMTRD